MTEDPSEKYPWFNKYQTKHLQAVSIMKVEMGCADCGFNAHPAALDFDHTDGKTRNISTLRSMKAVLEEIERHKCVLRCANCHRIKTAERARALVVEDREKIAARNALLGR